MSQSRQLADIMFTDILGYTALMQENEQKAVALIKHYNTALNETVSLHEGKVLNYYGDGSLCTFPSATEAINCAMDLQKKLQSDPVVPLRIGLHIGEVFFEDGKALGDGVNVASRIQSLGQANTILFSKEIYDKVKNHPEFKAVSLGQFDFKNVDEPLEVFALANEGLIVPKREQMSGKLKKELSKKKNIIRRNLTIAASVLILLIAGVFLYLKYFNQQNNTVEKSIAVLPFVDMSAAKDQEYFSDGLSEELLNLLSKISELKVIGRTSSFSFKGKNEDLRSIAQKLGVAHILEGSVRKDRNKIRVTAQLIKATDGSHLWSETYDRDLEDIFKLQDEIAGEVVKQLKLKLLNTASNAASASINTEVYNLILQGNYFSEKRDKESLAKALDYYLKALAIDSLNPRSWAAVGKCYILQTSWSWIDRNEGIQKASIAANKSIDLDETLAEGHRVLGEVKMYDFDWNGAEAEYQKVLNLEPGNADVLRIIGFLYRCTGRIEEGIQFNKKSIALDPLKGITYFNYGQILYYANRFEEAIEAYKKVLELNPNFPRAHIFLGKVYLLQGKPEMALTEMLQEADGPWKNFGLILAYHALGRKTETDKLFSDFISRFQKKEMYQIAEIYAYRGEKDKAFDYLEKYYIAREGRLTYLKGDPFLKNLESDPRYITFMKKMKLPVD